MEKEREACENCVYNQKWFCIIMGDYVKRSGHCSEYEEQKKKLTPHNWGVIFSEKVKNSIDNISPL